MCCGAVVQRHRSGWSHSTDLRGRRANCDGLSLGRAHGGLSAREWGSSHRRRSVRHRRSPHVLVSTVRALRNAAIATCHDAVIRNAVQPTSGTLDSPLAPLSLLSPSSILSNDVVPAGAGRLRARLSPFPSPLLRPVPLPHQRPRRHPAPRHHPLHPPLQDPPCPPHPLLHPHPRRPPRPLHHRGRPRRAPADSDGRRGGGGGAEGGEGLQREEPHGAQRPRAGGRPRGKGRRGHRPRCADGRCPSSHAHGARPRCRSHTAAAAVTVARCLPVPR